ncbi:MAG: putative ABC exporter domain-containing protein [Clostridiales bacterium]|nr:putative ABC exporter domain-containing protein [Clostridiales bacterium]
MGTYGFLYGKIIKNRIRKIFQKPVTCIYVVLMAAYFIWLGWMLNGMMAEAGWATRENLARVLCMLSLYLTPANFAAYAKRKGLVFLPGDVHFLFSSPAGPKANLIYVYAKTLLSLLVMGILVFFAGVFWFHISPVQMLLYILVCMILDSVLQGAIVVLLYGNEKLSERGNRIFSWLMYGIIIGFVLVGAVILMKEGMKWSALMEFFDGAWISMIPLIGWSLGAMRLIILGPDTINIVCTVLYLLSVVVLTGLAWKMKCTGQYYEDAMKFADDYQEARKKSQKGEVAIVGRKKKYKQAQVVYKGSGARAIFYRQILEYKKERFFIFGFATLLYLAGGIFIGYLGWRDPSLTESIGRYYIIPGVMAYVSFILCSYKTKWNKELESPYVYLIPEPAFQKMWYATVIDHIRSAIHASLLTVPAMIGLKIELWYFPVFVLIQVCMSAAGLYSSTVCSVIFGNTISDGIKRTLHMFLYLFAILIAIPGAVAATIFVGVWAGLSAAALYLAILAGLMGWAGSRCFARMES